MATANVKAATLTDDDRTLLASTLAEFRDQWDENRLPVQLERLPADCSWRLLALEELVKLDLERQWQRGRKITVEVYLRTYPELGSPGTISLELIKAECDTRRRHGVAPDWSEMIERFPSRAEELRT